MRSWSAANSALRAAAFLAALWAAAFEPAAAADVDCGRIQCTDVERLPAGAGVDLGEIVRRARRFYGVDAKAYIVASGVVKATLPYMIPRQEPFVMQDQIHIPEVYHAITEISHTGERHYVWHYIIGHEMAHVYQERLNLIQAMSTPYQSVVMAELHADFLSGFFMAREYGLNSLAIEQLLRELKALPSGPPGSASYHGAAGERFFMATQGALMAYRQPTPALRQASAQGIRCAFDLLAARNSERSLADICR